jgi:hypothetical protein
LPAYEANLSLVLWAWDEESSRREPEVWRKRFAEAVRKDWRPLRAYLAMRMKAFQEERPDTDPPLQAILLGRMYRIPPPGVEPWSWGGRVEQPIGRWRPKQIDHPELVPIESYDPVTRRFMPVRVDEGAGHE